MRETSALAPGVYWVGVTDWDLRNFHGYTTDLGSTYNAYLIVDEKITLIDTVKAAFFQEMLGRIKQYVDPSKIDYIVAQHVEMDHSGSIPALMEVCRDAVIVTSASGEAGLRKHYGDYAYKAVKLGDSLSIGKRSLQFVPVPMVHWPDNMMTYCPEEKILFSNDAFGQHYASNFRFDDEVPFSDVMAQAAKYYANIVLPYDTQAGKALDAAKKLEIGQIAGSHGVIWRKHVADIIEKYAFWSQNGTTEKAVIVYDTMWGSTRLMARAIEEGFTRAGIPVMLADLKNRHISDLITDILEAKYVLVGSPTLNNNILPTVSAFLTYMKGLAPKGRLAAAFGSYGWGGQSVGQVEEALKAMGFTIFLPQFKQQYIPKEGELAEITGKVCEAVEGGAAAL